MDDFACFLRACLVVFATSLAEPSFPATFETGAMAGTGAGHVALSAR